MKAVVFNLGCKVNQYESDLLLQGLEQRGYKVFSELVPADLYIINTCAVTAEAEKKSRQAIKRCISQNANADIYICGCASENKAESFNKESVKAVFGVKNKNEILNLIDISEKSFENTLKSTNRTRAYVKIQDGCNNFCSYCIIPYLRGKSVSRDIKEIVSEIEILSKTTNEIVITGINLMLYGKDNNISLEELINCLSHIDVRIRLGSFYVEGLSEPLLDALFSLKKFCPHFHLSLQSGDNEVLKAMNRHYTVEEYTQKISLIKKYDNNAAITTDIIVGYPTETEEQFQNTLDFVEQTGFSDIHIFPYSSREGTKAASLKPLPKTVIKERVTRLTEIKKRLQKNYLNANIGIKQNTLFEERIGDYSVGYSERYLRIYAKTDKKMATVVPSEIYLDGLKGDEYYE